MAIWVSKVPSQQVELTCKHCLLNFQHKAQKCDFRLFPLQNMNVIQKKPGGKKS